MPVTPRKTFHFSYSAVGQKKRASNLLSMKYRHYQSLHSKEDMLGILGFGEMRGETSALILSTSKKKKKKKKLTLGKSRLLIPYSKETSWEKTLTFKLFEAHH